MTRPGALDPLAGKRIVAVFAHPDDESLACGGTLALCAERGARVSVLCLTRGERGAGPNPSEELGRRREQELNAAARVLGLAEVQIREYPDGGLAWVDPVALRNEVASLLGATRPDAVITFGRDGLYWHRDHIAACDAVTAALGPASDPAVYWVTMPPGVARAIVEKTKRALDPDDVPRLFNVDADAFGAGAAPPTLVVDARHYATRKLAALRCHRSQVAPDSPLGALSEADAIALLGHEHFHRPAFQKGAGGPLERALLTDPALGRG